MCNTNKTTDMIESIIEQELRTLAAEFLTALDFQHRNEEPYSERIGLWVPSYIVMHMKHLGGWGQCSLQQGEFDSRDNRTWIYRSNTEEAKWDSVKEAQNRKYYELWHARRKKELGRILNIEVADPLPKKPSDILYDLLTGQEQK